jgi:hypothetical protein
MHSGQDTTTGVSGQDGWVLRIGQLGSQDRTSGSVKGRWGLSTGQLGPQDRTVGVSG